MASPPQSTGFYYFHYILFVVKLFLILYSICSATALSRILEMAGVWSQKRKISLRNILDKHTPYMWAG